MFNAIELTAMTKLNTSEVYSNLYRNREFKIFENLDLTFFFDDEVLMCRSDIDRTNIQPFYPRASQIWFLMERVAISFNTAIKSLAEKKTISGEVSFKGSPIVKMCEFNPNKQEDLFEFIKIHALELKGEVDVEFYS